MKHDPIGSGRRKSVNLSIDTGIVDAARQAGLNLSQVSEIALRDATRKVREAKWQEDHRDWIEANNAWVEKNGLPLAKVPAVLMAKFDVHRAPDGYYWLDCQADLFGGLNSRFVVPLATAHEVRGEDPRLNPTFRVDGGEVVMLTHFAGAVPARDLHKPIASLGEHEYVIGAALDMLISGF